MGRPTTGAFSGLPLPFGKWQSAHATTSGGLPRATTISLEARPDDVVVTRAGGGRLKRDEYVIAIESNPWPWLSRILVETAIGDRVDYANNRIGRGAFIGVTAKEPRDSIG